MFLCISSEALKGDCGGLIFVTVLLRYNIQAIGFTHWNSTFKDHLHSKLFFKNISMSFSYHFLLLSALSNHIEWMKICLFWKFPINDIIHKNGLFVTDLFHLVYVYLSPTCVSSCILFVVDTSYFKFSEITWGHQAISECSLTNTYTSIYPHSQARGTVTAEGSLVVDAVPVHADAWGLTFVNICPGGQKLVHYWAVDFVCWTGISYQPFNWVTCRRTYNNGNWPSIKIGFSQAHFVESWVKSVVFIEKNRVS